ncbi:Protein of unknown function [Gryllus bimaculatus]|nr:Protein of unknown function [Gryllus bimaculatus]
MNSTLVMRSIGRQGGTVWTVWCMCAKLHEFQSFLQDPESSSRLETVKRTSLRQSIANLFATPPSSKRPEQNEPQTTVKVSHHIHFLFYDIKPTENPKNMKKDYV